MRIERHLEELAARTIREALGLEEDAPALLRSTQDAKHGDYQINAAMPLAKQLERPPREIGTAIAEAMGAHPEIASAEVAGPGFVNLRLDDGFVAAQLAAALADAAQDGVPPVDRPEKIIVDFSAPNIAKQMHVGHLRSTILGDAIARLLVFVGHDVVRDNHIGDWGTQFGLLIVGMDEWGSDEVLRLEPIDELERVYKLASARAKEDEAFAESARKALARLQSGDPESLDMWKRFVAATRHTLETAYARLDVRFDEWLGESAYHEMLPGVIEELRERGIAREDQGALCVFFNELADAPADLKKLEAPFIVRKRDGAFLYSTTDIATVLYRRDHFHADRAVYVVGTPQTLHFRQLFAVARMLGIEMRLDHVAFGSVLGPDGKPLKTRAGDTIKLAALLDEAEERAGERIREQGLDIPEGEIASVAHAVGIGAVKYADLRQNRMSDYIFDWDKLISFQGNAGPYLQYAYARIQSIFRKGEVDPKNLDGRAITLGAPAEAALARQLLKLGDVAHAAAETYQPHLVCDHLYSLSRAFSTFYEGCPVLKAEPDVRASRLALSALTARQLRRGLALLGIDVVERM